MYSHRLGDLPSSADNLLTAMPTVSRADLAVQTVELAERPRPSSRARRSLADTHVAGDESGTKMVGDLLIAMVGSNYVRR